MIISCSKKSIHTRDFLNKISLNEWNKETHRFVNKECSIEVYKYYNDKEILENYFVDEHTNDTINSLEKHLNFYVKNRENILNKLKEKADIFPSKMNTLVIIEKYLGLNNSDISYTISSNDLNVSLIFYYQLDKFEEIQELKNYNDIFFDSIVKMNNKCSVNYNGHLNTVEFQTVISLNANNEITYNVKTGFFGSFIID